jgi:hypothetical protein
MRQKCFIRGGLVRIRYERDTLWSILFTSKYARNSEDKARFLTYALKAYERPEWSMTKILQWASLRRMPHA